MENFPDKVNSGGSTLKKRLQSKVTKDFPCLIFDGGMGTSLQDLGVSDFDSWLTPIRMSDKSIRETVKRVHLDFLNSGVDIIATNTCYDSQFDMVNFGNEQNFKNTQWIVENIDAGNEAIDEFMATKSSDSARPLLAMSIGGLSTAIEGRASTANREQPEGSDYLRREGFGYKLPDIELYFNVRFADDVLLHAARHGVAVLAVETVSDLLEVKVICDVLKTKSALLSETGLCTWVTLTCLTENTVDTGGCVTACVQELAQCQQATGVGVNCTEPHLVTPIVTKIKQVLQDCDAADKFIVVYPNSGETYLSRELKDGETNHWKKQSMYEDWNYADAAMEWVNLGVDIIGGCCRITAKDIAQLAKKRENV